MVFIIRTDIFKHGIPIYTINRHFEEEGGRERMCEAVEKYAKDYAEHKAEIVRLNSLLESVRKLMANMKFGAEQAMNALEVNEHDREIY